MKTTYFNQFYSPLSSVDICTMTKKEAGFILYLQDVELEEISKTLEVNYNTVAKWSSVGNWKEKKTEKLLQKQTSQDRIWGLISYQLEVIELITAARKQDRTGNETVKELKETLIDRGDIDALQKLFTTIKSKEVTWDAVVKSTRSLIEHLEKADIELAKAVTPLVNEWLNIQREVL